MKIVRREHETLQSVEARRRATHQPTRPSKSAKRILRGQRRRFGRKKGMQ